MIALGVVISVGAVVSNRPDYQIAFSGLTDHEVAKVNKALSEDGLSFRVSQPPAPFTVFVDEDDRSQAYKSVYGAGALDKPLKGIMSDPGVASVFSSAEERQQGVRKREWEEMEKMLEVLDFVVSAKVRTSPGNASPLGLADANPTTASVTLRIAGDVALSPGQAQTVANLVSRGLGVDKQHLMVSDQSGVALFDGAEFGDDARDVEDLLAHQAQHDTRLMTAANSVLDSILGPNKARVTVSSEWDFAQSTTRTETPVGKGTLVSQQKTTSERPVFDPASSSAAPAGVAGNAVDPAAAVPARADRPLDAVLEKTSEESTQYRPTVTTQEQVRFVPELRHLSVALFLDASIPAEEVADLEAAIKTSVGFQEARDEFSSVVLAFAVPAVPEAEEGAGADEPDAGPSPLVNTLLRRGVEIVTALVFVFLLLKSLRSTNRPAAEEAGAEGKPTAEQDVDPELLARAHVEELLKSDPEKVGEILARWARDPAGAR